MPARVLSEPSNTVYYMFGGPDFPLCACVFSKREQLTSWRAWRPGRDRCRPFSAPEIRGCSAGELFRLARLDEDDSEHPLLITKEMRTDLGPRGASAGPTLPILYVFLARRGCHGNRYGLCFKNPAEGVKNHFRQRPAQAKHCITSKTDLSGGKKAPFLSLVRQTRTLVLVCSRLLHNLMHGRRVRAVVRSFSSRTEPGDYFRMIPGFLCVLSRGLERSIAYGALCARTQKRCSGKYHQPDLAAIYAKDPRRRPE